MKIPTLSGKNIKELHAELVSLLKAQFNLRIQMSNSQTKQTHIIKKVRRDIARVKTLLTQKAKKND
jgi:large subunit ribosomal protein L29